MRMCLEIKIDNYYYKSAIAYKRAERAIDFYESLSLEHWELVHFLMDCLDGKDILYELIFNE